MPSSWRRLGSAARASAPAHGISISIPIGTSASPHSKEYPGIKNSSSIRHCRAPGAQPALVRRMGLETCSAHLSTSPRHHRPIAIAPGGQHHPAREFPHVQPSLQRADIAGRVSPTRSGGGRRNYAGAPGSPPRRRVVGRVEKLLTDPTVAPPTMGARRPAEIGDTCLWCAGAKLFTRPPLRLRVCSTVVGRTVVSMRPKLGYSELLGSLSRPHVELEARDNRMATDSSWHSLFRCRRRIAGGVAKRLGCCACARPAPHLFAGSGQAITSIPRHGRRRRSPTTAGDPPEERGGRIRATTHKEEMEDCNKAIQLYPIRRRLHNRGNLLLRWVPSAGHQGLRSCTVLARVMPPLHQTVG